MTVNAIQHGGSHYKADYQHWDLVADLQLNYYVANATKYVTRHRKKNGREDILKAGHYLEKLIELIEHDRMPPPIEPPHLVMIARSEMLNRFFDANDIDVEGAALESRFMMFTANATSVADLRHAYGLLDFILKQQYAEESAPAPRPEGLTNVPVHIAAAMDSRFGPEGYWGDGRVLWKCRVCGTYFQAMDGVVPSSVHQCPRPAPLDDGSEATPAYVDQDR